MLNIWKVSTLVLAGALAFVVGRGAIAESMACDGPAEVFVPTAEQVSRTHLARSIAFLDRAEQEIEQATATSSQTRANALAQIAKARATIDIALNPESEIAAPPPPPPRKPVQKPAPKPKDPFTTRASAPVEIINPFLRSSGPTQPAVHTTIKDPWATTR